MPPAKANLVPAEIVIFVLELLVLYALGSYAMSRLAGLGNARGVTGKLAFYLLVMPGVVAHESAHYLAAKLTFTPVGRFVPFAPSKDSSGRLTLGYVEHGARNPVTGAIIGLAPVVFNPLALVVLTGLLTPLDLTAALSTAPESSVQVGAPVEMLGALGGRALGFLESHPLGFVLWVYLAVSLALGSCPSREDLVAVPAAAMLVLLGAWAYATVFGSGFVDALVPVATSAISIYFLPVLVAGAAAFISALLLRASR